MLKNSLSILNVNPYIEYEKEISSLKQRLNAVIFAHYYQDTEIQDIADYIGDTIELSKIAMNINAKMIVYCGVRFMAETLQILCPKKKVLLPDLNAGCSLENSCETKEFQNFREKNPNHLAITYINSSTEIKALSDIIVTTTNAEKIINSIPLNQPILFSPDKHLGNYLIRKTGRQMTLWNGSCVVHENFSERELIKIKTARPKAQIIAHPKCPTILIEYADFVGSKKELINYIGSQKGKEFIVLTEPSILHRMHQLAPENKYYDVPSLDRAGCINCSLCPYMKINTVEKIYHCLQTQEPSIILDPLLMNKARIALSRMLEYN